jgi:hypothetical protein
MLSYEFIRPQDDIVHDGVYESSARDDAEEARSRFLRDLADTPGRESFDALHRLLREPALGGRREWLLMLARERAEQDAAVPWQPYEVERFEATRLKRPKSGEELFALALRRFDEINDQLSGGDFSQAELLRRVGQTERDFQLWVADRLDLLSRGAYVVSREDEVIDKKKPDIRLHSQEADSKVAVEMKVAGSYSGAELATALKRQLVGQYLRDERCRFGIFVLVPGGKRKSWRVGSINARSISSLVEALRNAFKRPLVKDGVELKTEILSLSLT